MTLEYTFRFESVIEKNSVRVSWFYNGVQWGAGALVFDVSQGGCSIQCEVEVTKGCTWMICNGVLSSHYRVLMLNTNNDCTIVLLALYNRMLMSYRGVK